MLLYLAVLEDEIGVVLAQHDEDGRTEKAVSDLSRTFLDVERNETTHEKHCGRLGVGFTLRHYFLAHQVHYIAKMDPFQACQRVSRREERKARVGMFYMTDISDWRVGNSC